MHVIINADLAYNVHVARIVALSGACMNEALAQELIESIKDTFSDGGRNVLRVTTALTHPTPSLIFKSHLPMTIDILKLTALRNTGIQEMIATSGSGDDEGPKVVIQGEFKGSIVQIMFLLNPVAEDVF